MANRGNFKPRPRIANAYAIQVDGFGLNQSMRSRRLAQPLTFHSLNFIPDLRSLELPNRTCRAPLRLLEGALPASDTSRGD
jgi:hypothetical protein